MVVLGASIVTQAGRVLLARQFMEVSRMRLEGLLAAFPKLLGAAGRQHTFIETDSVRYVYQPLDSLYLVLLTSKGSNLVDDLDALHLLAKAVPEYCHSLSERDIETHKFDLVFVFDEFFSLGYRERIDLGEARTLVQMESADERAFELRQSQAQHIAQDIMRRKVEEIDRQKQQFGQSAGSGLSELFNFGSSSSSSSAAAAATGATGAGPLPASNPYGSASYGTAGSGAGQSFSNNSVSYSSSGSGAGQTFSSATYMGPSSGASASSVSYSVGTSGERRTSGAGTSAAAAAAAAVPAQPAALGSGMQLGRRRNTDALLHRMRQEGSLTGVDDGHGAMAAATAAATGDESALAAAAAAQQARPQVEVAVVERVRASVQNEGGSVSLDVTGTLTLRVPRSAANARIQLGPLPRDVSMRTNPNVDRAAFQQQLALVAPAGFPVDVSLSVLKWRMQSTHEDDLPLVVTVWPSTTDTVTSVTLEIELKTQRRQMILDDVVVAVPLRSGQEPAVNCSVGAHKFDHQRRELLWRIPRMDVNTSEGRCDFRLPRCDPSQFTPVTVTFTSPNTFSQLSVVDVVDSQTNAKLEFVQVNDVAVDRFEVLS